MDHVLAIDQGTTGSRAIVYDRRGRAVASAYEEFPQIFPQARLGRARPRGDLAERRTGRSRRSWPGSPAASIAAIGITNQRETTVIWDRRTGRPVHNAIVWQCRRTADRCRELNEDPRTVALIREKDGPAGRCLFFGDQGGVAPRLASA